MYTRLLHKTFYLLLIHSNWFQIAAQGNIQELEKKSNLMYATTCKQYKYQHKKESIHPRTAADTTRNFHCDVIKELFAAWRHATFCSRSFVVVVTSQNTFVSTHAGTGDQNFITKYFWRFSFLLAIFIYLYFLLKSIFIDS